MSGAEAKVAESLGSSLLKKAGSSILEKIGGFAVNAALGALGLTSNPDAPEIAALAQIEQTLLSISGQLDTISAQISDQTIQEKMTAVNDASSHIDALFAEMLAMLIANSTSSTAVVANTEHMRKKLTGNIDVYQKAIFINTEMTAPGLGGGTLRSAWDYYFSTIPDPMDVYTTMKQFSLRYQKTLSNARSILKYLANTDPANTATDFKTRATVIYNSVPAQNARTIDTMMSGWDQLLEGQATSIIQPIIHQMAQGLLVDSGLGVFPMFWDRSSNLGVRLRKGIIVDGNATEMIGLSDRCTDTQDLCGLSYLFRDNQAKVYYIRFKSDGKPTDGPGWDSGVDANGYKGIGVWIPGNHDSSSWQDSWVITPTSAIVHSKGADERVKTVVEQPLKLSIIKNAAYTDNIYYHIHIAAPAPLLKHWNSDPVQNTDQFLTQYIFEAENSGQALLYFNHNCDDQIDTQFAFRATVS